MDRCAPSFRMTRQRRVILEELQKTTAHPSADALHRAVRRRLPRVSLGTVYRNLERMSERGVVQKLDVAGTQKRFDAMTGNHYHVMCTECGRIDDLDVKPRTRIEDAVREATHFEITGHRLTFTGVCPTCRAGT